MAHESDISCLDFSQSAIIDHEEHSIEVSSKLEETYRRYFLASGSRDRLTHIYQIKVALSNPLKKGAQRVTYQSLAIFDDHESTVTGIRLLEERSASGKVRLKFVSASTDKNLVIRHSKQLLKTLMDKTLEDDQEDSFEVDRKEAFEERILAMDVTTKDCGYILTAHDKFIQL